MALQNVLPLHFHQQSTARLILLIPFNVIFFLIFFLFLLFIIIFKRIIVIIPSIENAVVANETAAAAALHVHQYVRGRHFRFFLVLVESSGSVCGSGCCAR